MNDNPNYYAVLPASVRYDKNLTSNEKLLYCEITALSDKKGYCWATNKYFAELYNTTERTIKRWVKNLETKKYIRCEVHTLRYDDGTIKKERKIHIDKNSRNHSDKNCQNHSDNLGINHSDKNCQNHSDKNVPYNNTEINNTVNNNTDIKYIVEYLNEKAGTNYRYTTNSTKKHIVARLNEGFTIDDFKTVIDKKVEQWQDDKKMSKFIRPETLFGSKFEGYLNETEPTSMYNY